MSRRGSPPSTAVSITNENAAVFDTRDIPEANQETYRDLYLALQSKVAHFTVEFLYTNPVKPHVVFKLNFWIPVSRRYTSARLSMELGEGEYGEQGPGNCQIKLCGYTGRTERATAGFQFPVHQSMHTLGQIVDVIEGRHSRWSGSRSYTSDLSRFEFTEVRGYFDGCRDWIAQSFVRLHTLGVISSWSMIGILGPDNQPLNMARVDEILRPRQGNRPINWRRAGFDEIIDKFFALPVERDNQGRLTVYYHDLPLERGTFLSSRFVRATHDCTNRHVLPYRPERTQLDGASGSGRGGSSGNGSSSAQYGGSSAYGGSLAYGGSSAYGTNTSYPSGSGSGRAYEGNGNREHSSYQGSRRHY